MAGEPRSPCDCDIQRCGARTYLETLITHERESRLASERYSAEALKLQAAEYERRLEALNNEHARLDKAQATYVSRETYELNLRTEREARELLAEQLIGSRAEHKGAADRTILIFGGLLSLATLGSGLIRVFVK